MAMTCEAYDKSMVYLMSEEQVRGDNNNKWCSSCLMREIGRMIEGNG